MILGFNKSPGAYIDTQYPDNVSERMSIKTSDLMNIYALHRMRNMEPNYLQMKIKNVSVASFYTGFSFKHYVGKPNFTITIILSDKDNPSSDFEGMLRRIAYNILPERDDLFFEELFIESYEELKLGNVKPYWEEYLEGEGSHIATIDGDKADVIEQEVEAEDIKGPEDLSFDDQFEKYAMDELKEEVKDLRKIINEKNEQLRELTKSLTEKVSEKSDHSEEIQLLQNHLDEANAKLDDWSLNIADLAEKNAILMETVRKLTEMSMQQSEEMERQGRKIIEQGKALKEKDAKISELTNKIVSTKVELAECNVSAEESQGNVQEELSEIKKDNDELMQELKSIKEKYEEFKEKSKIIYDENNANKKKIEELEFELEKAKEDVIEDEDVHEDLADQIIDLKKSLKVLRRERDHYKNIVKEKNLL